MIETTKGISVVKIPPREMTQEQAKQAFGPNGLRSEGEQKAWKFERVDAEIISEKVRKASPSWTVRAGYVYFSKNARLDKTELLTIIKQLK